MNTAEKRTEPDYSAMRLNMIEGQLRPNGIKDERILSAMETLPRERFVPPQLAGICCIDNELTVWPGRSLLRPLVLARLVQAAAIGANDRVLDVGTMTGYSAVLLAQLAKEVVALESEDSLTNMAATNITALGALNAALVSGKLSEGWKAKAPYNAIIIQGGVEFVPETLFEQLAEGGRLVAVMRHYGAAHAAHTGEIIVHEKIRGAITKRSLADASASLLADFARPRAFTF